METIKIIALVALYLIIMLVVLGLIGQGLDRISNRDDEEGGEDEED